MQFAKAFEYKKWANSQLLDFGARQFSNCRKTMAHFSLEF